MKTYLTSSEITKMVEAAPCLRDQVIVSFYADTGARCSELLGVKVENIDLKAGMVLIPHLKRGIKKQCPGCGKSAGRHSQFCVRCGHDLRKVVAEGILQRSRLINIGQPTARLLQEYISLAKLRPGDYLVKLSRQHIGNIIRELAAKAGLEGKAMLNPESGKKHYVHPHSFRDALAVDWLLQRGDTEGRKALQEQLGHQSFDTTARYFKLTSSSIKKIGDEVRKARFGRK